jgi:hypothetical protein
MSSIEAIVVIVEGLVREGGGMSGEGGSVGSTGESEEGWLG